MCRQKTWKCSENLSFAHLKGLSHEKDLAVDDMYD
jgi:hypothetical protein